MNFNRKDVLAATKGNMQAFEQIYIDINNDLYKMALYILGNSELAKDIVSETIIDALKGIKKLNILVGTHPDSDHVGGLEMHLKVGF